MEFCQGAFGHCELERALPAEARDDPYAFVREQLSSGAEVVFVSGSKVLTRHAGGAIRVNWLTDEEIRSQQGLVISRDGLCFVLERDPSQGFPLVFLGRTAGAKARFAVDVASDAQDLFGRKSFMDLRTLAAKIDLEAGIDVSQVGLALSLCTFMRCSQFCSVCGTRLDLVELNTRSRCPACGVKSYPRVNPVAIALVISADGDKCLLVNPQRSRKGMVTAVSGFIEPCEPLDECVRREVLEECGIRVNEVVQVGSQPWPVGRGGICELMLGCFARAEDELVDGDVNIDKKEIRFARWFTKDELRDMLRGEQLSGMWIPPPLAIAHHLILRWVRSGTAALFPRL